MPPPQQPPLAQPLQKQKSWSPDACREEAWRRRKAARRSKSLTDEDLDELKGCIELGFGFGSDPEGLDRRLSDTLPALEFYRAVNQNYYDTVSRSSLLSSSSSSSLPGCDSGLSSPMGSPLTMFSPGDDPQTVKTRLKHWAQIVACSVKQSSPCY